MTTAEWAKCDINWVDIYMFWSFDKHDISHDDHQKVYVSYLVIMTCENLFMTGVRQLMKLKYFTFKSTNAL
jgi:hypothetical protein